jgi:hypothetical protein
MMSKSIRRCEGKRILVEDRDTAERSTRPLLEVGVEFWIQCLEEGAHEGELERRTSDRALSLDVQD